MKHSRRIMPRECAKHSPWYKIQNQKTKEKQLEKLSPTQRVIQHQPLTKWSFEARSKKLDQNNQNQNLANQARHTNQTGKTQKRVTKYMFLRVPDLPQGPPKQNLRGERFASFILCNWLICLQPAMNRQPWFPRGRTRREGPSCPPKGSFAISEACWGHGATMKADRALIMLQKLKKHVQTN